MLPAVAFYRKILTLSHSKPGNRFLQYDVSETNSHAELFFSSKRYVSIES